MEWKSRSQSIGLGTRLERTTRSRESYFPPAMVLPRRGRRCVWRACLLLVALLSPLCPRPSSAHTDRNEKWANAMNTLANATAEIKPPPSATPRHRGGVLSSGVGEDLMKMLSSLDTSSRVGVLPSVSVSTFESSTLTSVPILPPAATAGTVDMEAFSSQVTDIRPTPLSDHTLFGASTQPTAPTLVCTGECQVTDVTHVMMFTHSSKVPSAPSQPIRPTSHSVSVVDPHSRIHPSHTTSRSKSNSIGISLSVTRLPSGISPESRTPSSRQRGGSSPLSFSSITLSFTLSASLQSSDHKESANTHSSVTHSFSNESSTLFSTPPQLPSQTPYSRAHSNSSSLHLVSSNSSSSPDSGVIVSSSVLPTASSAGSPNYMLVLYVVPALTGLVVLAIAGALCLCVRRYRKRRRRHLLLVPLTDMEGSSDGDADSDEEVDTGSPRANEEDTFTLVHGTRGSSALARQPRLAFGSVDSDSDS